MRLIDVLNLITKGELKEETQMRIGCVNFFYRNGRLENGNLYPLFTSTYISKSALLQEVEMIGKDTNVATKIEEIDTEFLRYTFECEGTFRPVKAITSLGDKLNEVIRELNRRSE